MLLLLGWHTHVVNLNIVVCHATNEVWLLEPRVRKERVLGVVAILHARQLRGGDIRMLRVVLKGCRALVVNVAPAKLSCWRDWVRLQVRRSRQLLTAERVLEAD